MIKQLKILGGLLVILGIAILVFFIGSGTMMAAMYIQGIASAILLIIFVSSIFKNRYKSATIVTATATVFSFIGMLFDTWGNPIYNKPLEWLFSSQGQLVFENNVNNYAPGEYAINTSLFLVNTQGGTQEISLFILYGYRFFQYLVLYLIIGYLIRMIPAHKQFVPTKEIPSNILTAAEMQEVLTLLKENQKVKAVKYVSDCSKLSLSTCKKYVDWLEKEHPISF